MQKKILIVPDKFKGSLSSIEVGQAIAAGLKLKNDCLIEINPIADGGDGTLEVFRSLLPYHAVSVPSLNPRRVPITANYLRLDETAIIEMAVSSGIALLNNQLSPMLSDAYGTGLLVKHAIENGASEIIIGLGGSCSTEGGTSILEGMGYKFYDKKKNRLKMNGEHMIHVHDFIAPKFNLKTNFTLLTDVNNTMYGPQGAAYIYGPQKGASLEQVEKLDNGLRHISKVILDKTGVDVSSLRGAGAAGGAGGGLSGILEAEIHNGFDYIKKVSNLEEKIKESDVVITGEGQLDVQSLQGKVVGQLAALTTQHQKHLFCIVGNNTLDESEIASANIVEVHSLMDHAMDLADAIENASTYITDCARMIEL